MNNKPLGKISLILAVLPFLIFLDPNLTDAKVNIYTLIFITFAVSTFILGSLTLNYKYQQPQSEKTYATIAMALSFIITCYVLLTGALWGVG